MEKNEVKAEQTDMNERHFEKMWHCKHNHFEKAFGESVNLEIKIIGGTVNLFPRS